VAEVEQIASEAGIDSRLIRRAAQGLDVHREVNRPSAFAGAPTRLVFERVVDGEIQVDDFEILLNEIRREMGENGMPSVIGKSLAWTSDFRGGRRRGAGRKVDVSVVSRGGITTIRVEEELRNLAGALFGGIMGGGGGGTAGISIGIGMEVFHSAPVGFGLWAAAIASAYALARTIFTRMANKREEDLRSLIDKLEASVTDAAASRTHPDQISAGASRSLAAGEGGTATG
jgi:type IV secretory pathway TrbD component